MIGEFYKATRQFCGLWSLAGARQLT